MSAVRGRLNDAAPQKNWEFKVRPVPNTEPQLHGVYAVFHGEHSPETVLAKAKDRQERRERLAAARAAAEAAKSANGTATGDSAPPAATEAPQTPKERLAAQAAAKK
jgi:hypothetical protein